MNRQDIELYCFYGDSPTDMSPLIAKKCGLLRDFCIFHEKAQLILSILDKNELIDLNKRIIYYVIPLRSFKFGKNWYEITKIKTITGNKKIPNFYSVIYYEIIYSDVNLGIKTITNCIHKNLKKTEHNWGHILSIKEGTHILHGARQVYRSDILLSEENFENNYKHGPQKKYCKYKSTKDHLILVFEQNFKFNKRHGPEIKLSPESVIGPLIYKRNYKDGELHGEQLEYYENRILNYNNGKLHGLYKEYNRPPCIDENGKVVKINFPDDCVLIKQYTFENGLLHGLCCNYWNTGKPQNSFVYVKGDLNGPYKEWDKNENILYSLNFKDNKVDGTQTVYVNSQTMGLEGYSVFLKEFVLEKIIATPTLETKKYIFENGKCNEECKTTPFVLTIKNICQHRMTSDYYFVGNLYIRKT